MLRLRDGDVRVVATPGGGPNGMARRDGHHALVANNGGFLWTEVDGHRIPIDHPTHTNEPPGFRNGWIERVDLDIGRGQGAARRSATAGCCAVPTIWSSTRWAACGSPTTARAGASVDRSGLYYIPADGGTVIEKAFPLLGANGVGLVARQPSGLRGRDPHRAAVGVGPRRAR